MSHRSWITATFVLILTCLSAYADMDVKLTSTDGSTKLSIKNGASAEVASVDSLGNATFRSLSESGSTKNYILNQGSLQSGATFYVSSGTVAGGLMVDTYARTGGVINRNTTTVTVANTTTETSIYSFSVPANLMGTNRALHVKLFGTFLNNTILTSDVLTLTVKLGGTTIATKNSSTIATSATTGDVYVEVIIANIGTANNQRGVLSMTIDEGGLVSVNSVGTGTGAVDTTNAQTLDITVTHSAAGVNTSFTKQHAYTILE